MQWSIQDRIDLYGASIGLLLILISITDLTERVPSDDFAIIGLCLFVVGCVGAAYSVLKLVHSTVDDYLVQTKSSDRGRLNCALWIIFSIIVVATLQIVALMILKTHGVRKVFPDCAEGEYVHYDNNNATCRPCDFCNPDFGYCSATGACVCFDTGRDPTEKCDSCLPNWNAADNCKSCTGNFKLESHCTECAIGWAGANCDECAIGFGPEGLCNTCLEGFYGNPEAECRECLDCHGGTCLSNDEQATQFDDSVCTRTAQQCGESTDCPDGGNCAGRCRSTRRHPPKDLLKLYDNKICRTDEECNDPANLYAGICVDFVCCEESKFGDGTCISCGPGRRPTRCELCPAYDSLRNIECNGGGTCEGTDTGSVCVCDNEHSGTFCERNGEVCVSGFFASGDGCSPCPGVANNNFNGLAACNGHGICGSGGTCTCDVLDGEFKFAGESCNMCADGYAGDLCEQCAGLSIIGNNVTVCSGHGICVAAENGKNRCECNDGFGTDEATGSCIQIL